MKWVYTTIGIVIISLLLLSCADEPDQTELRVTIVDHPDGGYIVSYLECTIEGTLYDDDDVTPITATIHWMWSDTQSGSGASQWSDTYTFNSTTGDEVTAFYQAPAGYYWLGYWWVLVEWTDEDGTDRERESNRAYCYD